MDDNQLDKFFRDNIGDLEETQFDESAWETIVPAIQTLTPRPAWFRFWGNWLGAGGAVILLLMLGGMGYLFWAQNQQLKEISAKLSSFESGIPPQKIWVDTLWCENLVRDTLWMTLPLKAFLPSGLTDKPGSGETDLVNRFFISTETSIHPEDTATEVPFYAILELQPDSQTTDQFLPDTSAHSQASSSPLVAHTTDAKKKLNLPKVRISGIRVKAYGGAQGVVVKGEESKTFFSPSIEGEFVLNPHWSIVAQPGFSPTEYELHVNPMQPDFLESVENFPGLPPVEDLFKLKEIKTKGTWILVPVSIKYSFLPGEKIQPFVSAGILGIKGLNQDFVYELEENGVEDKRFVASGPVPWTWNSLQAALGGQILLSKRWIGSAEFAYSPGISVQGAEKRRFHIVGLRLGMGYIIK